MVRPERRSLTALCLWMQHRFRHAHAQGAPQSTDSAAPVSLPAVTVEAEKAPAKKKKTAKKKSTSSSTSASGAQPDAAATATTAATANTNPKSTLTPPAAYAGGQVATGGQLGMLGNRGVMDTPFNQTSYTAQTIQDQQARSVADVLLNDPSVRATQNANAGYGQDTFYIRGFYYDIGEQGLNGLYGLAPTYSTLPNFVERVELLKGPSALLNGMPPGGAVGGSINLVTKQAPDTPITQVTTTYQSRGLFGTQLDFARRYGDSKEWGVRFNGEYGAGDTAIERQDTELGDAVLNLDYRGERLRVSADVGYQGNDLSGVQRYITIAPAYLGAVPAIAPFVPLMNGTVPSPPEAGSNYGGMDWSYWNTSQKFAMVRGEFDVTKNVTAYASYGWTESDLDYFFASPAVVNANGDWVSYPLKGSSLTENRVGQAGVRADVDTGPINHLLNVNYSSVNQDATSRWVTGNATTCLPPPLSLSSTYNYLNICSNLYNPGNVAEPTTFGAQIARFAEKNLSSIGVSDTLSILNDRIQFTAGVRRQTAGSTSTNLVTGTAESPSTEASVWSPAYALLVKPVRNVSLYANYIEGLQMGTTVPNTFANAGEVMPPTQSKQKEAGVKVDFGRISTTVAAFEIERPSLVTTANNYQVLDGEQRNRGVEINVFGEVMPTVRVLGGVAFIDGRLTKTADANNDGKGDNDDHKAQGVANTNVNLSAEWDTPFPGLTVSGRVIYTSDSYINAANTYKIPDWTRYDLGARYTFASPFNGKPMTLRFGVENVANSSYYASSYSGDGIVTVGAPRTYLVSTTVNF